MPGLQHDHGVHRRRLEREFAGAHVVDLPGATVMPGLIDLHTHLTYVDRFDAGYGEAVSSGADSALRGIRREPPDASAPLILKTPADEGLLEEDKNLRAHRAAAVRRARASPQA